MNVHENVTVNITIS